MTDYLFDTHALVWWWLGDPALPRAVAEEIGDERNTIFVSAVSAWEVATKCRIGKWEAAIPVYEKFEHLARADGFFELGVSVSTGLLAGSLPGEHRDPFDRLLVAQSAAEPMLLLTCDAQLEQYGSMVRAIPSSG